MKALILIVISAAAVFIYQNCSPVKYSQESQNKSSGVTSTTTMSTTTTIPGATTTIPATTTTVAPASACTNIPNIQSPGVPTRAVGAVWQVYKGPLVQNCAPGEVGGPRRTDIFSNYQCVLVSSVPTVQYINDTMGATTGRCCACNSSIDSNCNGAIDGNIPGTANACQDGSAFSPTPPWFSQCFYCSQ